MTRPDDSLPPSAKLLTHLLAHTENDELSRSALYHRAGLPESTLDDALAALRDRGIVETETPTEDRRQTIYRLADSPGYRGKAEL